MEVQQEEFRQGFVRLGYDLKDFDNILLSKDYVILEMAKKIDKLERKLKEKS